MSKLHGHRRPSALLGELRWEAGQHLVVLFELLRRHLVDCHRRLVILSEEDVVRVLVDQLVNVTFDQ